MGGSTPSTERHQTELKGAPPHTVGLFWVWLGLHVETFGRVDTQLLGLSGSRIGARPAGVLLVLIKPAKTHLNSSLIASWRFNAEQSQAQNGSGAKTN